MSSSETGKGLVWELADSVGRPALASQSAESAFVHPKLRREGLHVTDERDTSA